MVYFILNFNVQYTILSVACIYKTLSFKFSPFKSNQFFHSCKIFINEIFIEWLKQPSKGVLIISSKYTAEHPYRSVILIKLLSNFVEITLWHGCSIKMLHIFSIFSEHFFLRTHLGEGGLLLNHWSHICHYLDCSIFFRFRTFY